ncbi:periplasmic phosphate-binding protein of phosphate ABC transporter [Tolypothrix tenuis PCC 7101]|uniref:Periplasmic phosphate-binding protein of phosphate ABC transporter n=1 Tax=Tolypothrix tenuis PCC 7101 TaxID=231146 RepID=A0A1Z4N359_9CYAN|nr:substrate-binding domain-containing protein [Aulosira sp. FACHB-113]BAZ00164.1 periplasmic phosphate-binding protein of phosphate ABC transporter [Tolypothrix tenuis PCC 7101]BAZ75915.1 periplasmic phosphate-binding protein of phosphate ABC transporter [Aulosira laxa NIES-50]
MDNTNQKKVLIKEDISIFLKGLIIGKVLTLMVIGGLLWWLLKPEFMARNNTDSSNPSLADSSNQNLQPTSNAVSTFGSLTNVPTDSFNYGGSTAWAPIRQVVDSQILSARPELKLRYLDPLDGSPGSSSGIRMLLDGKLDFAQSSRPLTEEEKAIAKERGFTLEQRQVGIDGIAVVVNPSLNLPGLTVDQLQQIYLGKLTNWNQVGGPNLPITAFSQKPENADTSIFSSNGESTKQALGSNVKYIYSTTDAVRQLSKTPGGIYYASARAVVPQCSVKPLLLGRTGTDFVSPYRQPFVSPEQCPRQRNQVNTEAIKNGSYPITSKLFVIIKQNKGQAQQAGNAYANLVLTDQGQQAIEQAGFVRVR